MIKNENGFFSKDVEETLLQTKRSTSGQSMLEYSVVLGIIVMVMFVMTPLVKRGTQGMIKIVADQVGVQNASEQRFDDSGHIVYSRTDANVLTSKLYSDVTGVVTYTLNDRTDQTTEVETNLGFTEEN